METLTVHLGLDELVNHVTLLADKSDLHRQPRCAVGRDRAGGLPALVGAHLIVHAAHQHAYSAVSVAPWFWRRCC